MRAMKREQINVFWAAASFGLFLRFIARNTCRIYCNLKNKNKYELTKLQLWYTASTLVSQYYFCF